MSEIVNKSPDQKSPPIGTKRVSIRSHRVHREMWDDLAAVTDDRIRKFKPHPPGWCVYINPEYTVEGPEFSLEFNQEARRCQRAWLTTMNRTLGNKNRRHFAIEADFLTRQLAHSGMLIVNGNVIPPHDWTSMEKDLQVAANNDDNAPPPKFLASPRQGPGHDHAKASVGTAGTTAGDRLP